MNDQTHPEPHDIPIGIQAAGMRRETDSMGEIDVPADRYWGRRRRAVSFTSRSATTGCRSAFIAPTAMPRKRVRWARLNRKRIDEMVDRSLMLVTALSPVIGYDKASAIVQKANDENLTLKEAALESGCIDEKRFDEIVDPKKMVGHGVSGS